MGQIIDCKKDLFIYKKVVFKIFCQRLFPACSQCATMIYCTVDKLCFPKKILIVTRIIYNISVKPTSYT